MEQVLHDNHLVHVALACESVVVPDLIRSHYLRVIIIGTGTCFEVLGTARTPCSMSQASSEMDVGLHIR